MSAKPREGETVGRTSLQPAREYEMPGGPLAKDLGSLNVKILSEFARGSGDDIAR